MRRKKMKRRKKEMGLLKKVW